MSTDNLQEVRFQYQDLQDLTNKIRKFYGSAAFLLCAEVTPPTSVQGGTPSEWTTQEIQNFLSNTNDVGRRFFISIIRRGRTAPIAEVKQELGLSNQQLGGPLSSLSKRYKALGKEPLHYVDWNNELYMINEKYLGAIQESLPL